MAVINTRLNITLYIFPKNRMTFSYYAFTSTSVTEFYAARTVIFITLFSADSLQRELYMIVSRAPEKNNPRGHIMIKIQRKFTMSSLLSIVFSPLSWYINNVK